MYLYLFDSLRLSQRSFSNVGTGLPGLNQNQQGLMCLAQGHNAVMLVRLEPVTLRSRVKYSTNEPLHSLSHTCNIDTISMEMSILYFNIRTLFLKTCSMPIIY